MVGELVAFISFLSLSVSVFLESVKHLIDVVFIIPRRESNASALFTAHGHGKFNLTVTHISRQNCFFKSIFTVLLIIPGLFLVSGFMQRFRIVS